MKFWLFWNLFLAIWSTCIWIYISFPTNEG